MSKQSTKATTFPYHLLLSETLLISSFIGFFLLMAGTIAEIIHLQTIGVVLFFVAILAFKVTLNELWR